MNHRFMKCLCVAVALSLLATASVVAQTSSSSLTSEVQSVYPQVQALYIDLHEHPELSLHEVNTAAKLAAQLRQLGYEVTEHVGGNGVVAILGNGSGPVIMLRTELDALPARRRRDSLTPAMSPQRTMRATRFPSCMPADTIFIWRRW